MSSLIDIEQLLAPIPGDNRVGEDIRWADVTMEMEEARRADDPYLPRAEWEHEKEFKEADWGKLEELANGTLIERSKDLPTTCWLCEALGHRYGFAGMTAGVQLLDGLLREYWEDIYPSLAEDGLEERIAKLSGLAIILAPIVQRTPITEKSSGGYAWNHWQESRGLENLRRHNPSAAEQALADGKVSSEVFDKAVADSSAEFYFTLKDQIEKWKATCVEFEHNLDQRFEADAPNLSPLHEANDQVLLAIKGIFKQKGLTSRESASSESSDSNSTGSENEVGFMKAGSPRTRVDALRHLSEIADFFSRTEPHSPVAYLVQRAVRWADMPLDAWLQEVIKEEAVLSQLRETLGLRPHSE